MKSADRLPLTVQKQDTKFTELENILNGQFIGQADMEQARDAAASAAMELLTFST